MTVQDQIQRKKSFAPPADWHLIRTIDLHTGGEPLRVILDGFPEIGGDNILARRRYVRDHYDHLRRALMHEPRGHADMYGCLLTPPNDAGADFGILFLHNEGYSTMCGHAVIGIAKLAVVMGWVEKQEPETRVTMDAPCGRIEAFAKVENGEVTSVYFHGVPSFVLGTDLTVDVPGLGSPICPTSTAAGVAILQMLSAEVAGELLRRGVTPRYFVSANIDGGEEHNEGLIRDMLPRVKPL